MSAGLPDSVLHLLDDLRKGKRLASENQWVSYQPFLLSRGYKLRSRYAPEWEPSWKDPDISMGQLSYHEDSLTPDKNAVTMDAVRLADNRHVILKKLHTSSEELQIAQFLSSNPLCSDSRNHSVPILETIYDPYNKDVAFIVMPILLQMDHLPFRRVGEFAEAVRQYLTPDTCDGVNPWKEWRERHSLKSLRYYFIDFGLSRRYSSNKGVQDVGILGQDQSYPERSATTPYDPFKTDIYHLGRVILRIVDEYDGLEYFTQVGNAMTRKNPEDRASLLEMLAVVDRLKPRQLKRRVWAKENSKLSRILMQYFGYKFPI